MELRWYQRDSVAACWDYMRDNPGKHPLICAPTGAGKSVIIAEQCRQAVEHWGGRPIILAHRKELLEQNADKIGKLTGHRVGIYSAGLRRRDLDADILVAGIASIYQRAHEVGRRDLVIVDEAHLLSGDLDGNDSMYRTFLSDLQKYCPHARLTGLTATPFRTGEGLLYGRGKLFSGLAFNVPIKRLIEEGFLCPPTTLAVDSEVNTTGLSMRAGEFVQFEMEGRFSTEKAVNSAVEELVIKCAGRNSILVFCAGVKHAELVHDKLAARFPNDVGCIHSELPELVRDTNRRAFLSGRIRWLVNVNVLTTGFDAPACDCIVLLRASASAGLIAQMIGRGFRIHPNKQDFLVLDFGGNLRRHGPIDDPKYGRKGGDGTGEAPTKNCPACGETNPAATRECPCGWLFPDPKDSRPAHDPSADSQAVVLSHQRPPEPPVPTIEHYVNSVSLSKHFKRGSDRPTLRIDYDVSLGNIPQVISEWVCIEHDGFAQRKARRWWRERSRAEFPATVDEAIRLYRCGALVIPARIWTRAEGHFTRVLRAATEELPETWSDEPVEEDLFSEPIDEEIPF